MSGIVNMSRRDFLKTAALFGGGLVLGVHLPLGRWEAEAAGAFEPNAFIRIAADNTVTFYINHSEMGQGVYTSLPMLIAEELQVDWTKIGILPAPVAPPYFNTVIKNMQITGGSTSVRSEWERLRKAGAAARIMLVKAAAAEWKVNPANCWAENSAVIGPSGKRLSFGQLADAAAALEPPTEIPLKKPYQWTIIGRPKRRLDTPDKVRGKAKFGLDEKSPGMLTAVVRRSPVFGGKVKSFDGGKAKAVPGVRAVVRISSGIAVVADDFPSAEKGRKALEIVWDEGSNAGLDTEKQLRHYKKMSKTVGAVARREGDFDKAVGLAAKRLEAEYEVPYLAHATMEPMNCAIVYHGHGGECEIMASTQFQSGDRDVAAKILGLAPERVKVFTTFLGGGFGRRTQTDFVNEAAQVSKAIGGPVKVVWTREDDTRGGYYRPRFYDRLSAGLDKDGMPVAWRNTIVGESILAGTPMSARIKGGIDSTSVEGAADIPYAIPNILVDLHTAPKVVPVHFWRSVGHSHTAFVVESFIDELAHAAGKDPYAYRFMLLRKHPRHAGVLRVAAENAGWARPLPAGRARGIAVHDSFGSLVAQVAEVSVKPDGSVRVHKVVCAVDCGYFVNPDTVKAQMESGIVMGLTAALYGKITFRNGRVQQSNFNDYPMLRMNEMPEVDVHIVASEKAPGGIGEPGLPPIAPAVCNAIFALTGKRIRTLPISADLLKKA